MANYLVSHRSVQMDTIFGALADSTRRDILKRLAGSDLTVSQIAKSYDYALPTVSKHLSVLERAHLIKKNKIGREYRVYLEPQTMRTVSEYVSFYKKFWTAQIGNLENFLAKK